MKLFGKAVRAAAVVLALGAGSMHAEPAKADAGAVVAGIAGGLILGTVLGSAANANAGYYAPAPSYYAPPPPRYYYPRAYYGPNVSFSFGAYSGPRYHRHGRRHGRRHFRRYGHHHHHHW